MNTFKILVVDDDLKTLELVRLYLQRDGYQVLTAENGEEAITFARQEKPDLVVLDLMLPKIDGLEVSRILREESDIPIIMLTARTTEEDRLTGLNQGADDYVVKPFSPRELAARVRAVLRRLPEASLNRGSGKLSYHTLEVDLEKHEARLSGKLVELTPVELRLLGIMVREPKRVFSREQLIQKVFGYDFSGSDRTVDVHIHNLRDKLKSAGSEQNFIKTIYGTGYKLIESSTGREE